MRLVEFQLLKLNNYFVLKQLEEDDKLIGMMIDKFKSLKIYDHINIIITSDHGMTSAKQNCKINAFEYLDKNLLDLNRTIFGQISHIYPKPGFVC